MNQPTKIIPTGYRELRVIDLSQNRRMLVWLNVLGTLLFFVLLVPLAALVMAAHGEQAMEGSFDLLFLLVFLATYILFLILHELIHGLFFWLFTRETPHFGFRGLYAFASAPDWLLPRWQYTLVGLSPLVLISLVGIAVLPMAPGSWAWVLALNIALNAGGSIGDLYVVGWMLLHREVRLVRDFGDAMAFYGGVRA